MGGFRWGATRQATAAAVDAYHALLEAVSDPVLLVGSEGLRVRYCNPAAAELLATADGDELVGQNLEEVFRFEGDSNLAEARQRLAEEGGVRDLAAGADGPNGRPLSLTLDLCPIRVAGGAECLQVVAHVSRQAEAPATTRPTHDYASHLIPSLTHELNNHLGAIRLGAELAAATGTMPDCRALQQEVDHCQRVLQTVVTQILRASAPPLDASAGPPSTDLARAIENALLLTQPQVLGKGISLKLGLPKGALPPVAAHLHDVQEALVRIILRSARSLQDQDHPRALNCRVIAQDGEVALTLSHMGSGLKWGELAALNGHESANPRGDDRVWTVIREGLTRFGGSLSASNSVTGGVRFRLGLPIADHGEEGDTYVHAS